MILEILIATAGRFSEAHALLLPQNKQQNIPAVCTQFFSKKPLEKALWVKKIEDGDPLYVFTSVEMAMRGITKLSEKTIEKRLEKSFSLQEAKHNLLYLYYSKIAKQKPIDVKKVWGTLNKFKIDYFNGEIGGKTAYLFALVAEATGYKDKVMIAEAYRMASQNGIYDATVRFVYYLQKYFPEKLREEPIVRYVKLAVDIAGDKYIPAMMLKSMLWKNGFFGNNKKLNDYYANLYEKVAEKLPSYLGGKLDDKDLSKMTKIEQDAINYIKSHGVTHIEPQVKFLYICS